MFLDVVNYVKPIFKFEWPITNTFSFYFYKYLHNILGYVESHLNTKSAPLKIIVLPIIDYLKNKKYSSNAADLSLHV